MSKNIMFYVCLSGRGGKEFHTLKAYKSLQGARKYAAKITDNVRLGLKFHKGLTIQIHKVETFTRQPIAIYFN